MGKSIVESVRIYRTFGQLLGFISKKEKSNQIRKSEQRKRELYKWAIIFYSPQNPFSIDKISSA